MKALLFVFVFYGAESVHSRVVEMPTMQGCTTAAARVNASRPGGKALAEKYLFAICVERQ